MDDRDQDLDDLEKELNQPFLHRPEEIDAGAGQVCFIDGDRECAGDCTAFNIYADPKQGPERCILLVYTANVAVNTQELVQLGRKIAQQATTSAADDLRAAIASAPVPDPFGGKR